MATNKKTSLTATEAARLPIVHEEWFRIGTSTAPANRELSEATITKMYAHIDKAKPHFIWCDSPLTSMIMLGILRKTDVLEKCLKDALRSSLRSSLESSLWSSLGSSLESSLWSSLGSSLESSLESSLRSSLESSLWSSLGSSLGSSLWSSLESSLWSSLRSSLESSLWSSLWSSLRPSSLCDGNYWHGQIDAYWIAFYFFCSEIGVVYDQEKQAHLSWWADLARSCFWWWPYENVCVISERPTAIRMNNRRVLHADGVPSVEFKDGFKIYSNDGVRLPEKYGAVKTADWQARWLLEETNTELRMCLIRAIGYDRICQELEAKKVDAWREYELIRIDNADVEPICLLKMTCPSTGKVHALRVEPTATDARKAITACNHGIDPESFIVEH